jgi:hypothetical protein
MRIAFAVWVVASLLVSLADARDSVPAYVQSYAILINGAVAGNESVTETVGDGGDIISTSEHDMLITDGLETKRMTFSTKMVLSKATEVPVSYTFKYTSGNSGDFYDVAVKNGRITRTLSRSGRTSEVNAPFGPDMVILDFSVYHQYDYLIRRYDMKKGGRQLFADFIPVIGNDVPLAMTFLGDENLAFQGGVLPVRNFSVEIVGILSATASMDKNGRLVRLLIPVQDLEVVRKDLLVSGNARN